jgi:hypothetical protein
MGFIGLAIVVKYSIISLELLRSIIQLSNNSYLSDYANIVSYYTSTHNRPYPAKCYSWHLAGYGRL